MKTNKEIAAEIAKHYGIVTLEKRMSDSLDFYDLRVTTIERMLIDAIEKGKAIAKLAK